MKKYACVIILIFVCQTIAAQSVSILNSGNHASFRGLSVVTDNIVWVSGSNGTVGRSVNGGSTWKWMTIPGFEKADFRDIEAFDSSTAVIMAISEPAYILRTTDGGNTWKTVYENNTTGIFLDAMEFWNDQSGIVIGDPINNRFFIGRTFDGGKTWQTIPEPYKPIADSGEACFASSGTNIRESNKAEAVFVSGGLVSHIFIKEKKVKLPIIQGTESTGANSIAVSNKKIMIVVGGDFNAKNDTTKNCVISKDGGYTWTFPKKSPNGYRSCVEYLYNNKWITCGLNGVDISNDNGNTWQSISEESFHVTREAKKGKAVYFAGANGRIGKLVVIGKKK